MVNNVAAVWSHGDFDIAAGQILWSPQRLAVVPPMPDHNEPFQRDIADLYLESNVLWASAVREAGAAGPFSSFIYQVALVDPQAIEPVRLLAASRIFWQLDGLKIEGTGGTKPIAARLQSVELAVKTKNLAASGALCLPRQVSALRSPSCQPTL